MSLRLLEALSRHASERPDARAHIELASGRRMTWSQLRDATTAMAKRVRDAVPTGSVLALCMANASDFTAAFLGILDARCSVFPVSADITAPELQAAIESSGAAAIVRDSETIELQRHRRTLAGANLLLQSSGTTGKPKIVLRDGPSLDAVAANMCGSIGFSKDDHVLAAVPLCHSYGLEHGLLAPVLAGSAVHLVDGFDVATVIRALAQDITIFPGVPSMFEMLANLGATERFTTLRTAYSAGGALPKTVFDNFQRKYHTTVGQLYGATEIGSITLSDPLSPHFDAASVGQPMNGVDVRILDDGQIAIRASSMFSGYVNEKDSPLVDGFFPTGDLGAVDAHGNLTITGRLKLLIDVGGLKVNPLEVEAVLSQHEAVSRCVVVPMRLSETVFRLKAVIAPRDPRDPPRAEDLRQFARARLTAHKVPRLFEIRETLPTSPTGKILRHLIEAS